MADVRAYPPDIQEEFQRVSDIIIHLLENFEGKVRVRVVNAFSPEGLWLALRRGARRYPTWLIGSRKVVGLDEKAITAAINEQLAA